MTVEQLPVSLHFSKRDRFLTFTGVLLLLTRESKESNLCFKVCVSIYPEIETLGFGIIWIKWLFINKTLNLNRFRKKPVTLTGLCRSWIVIFTFLTFQSLLPRVTSLWVDEVVFHSSSRLTKKNRTSTAYKWCCLEELVLMKQWSRLLARYENKRPKRLLSKRWDESTQSSCLVYKHQAFGRYSKT